jgi:hypothetical protein
MPRRGGGGTRTGARLLAESSPYRGRDSLLLATEIAWNWSPSMPETIPRRRGPRIAALAAAAVLGLLAFGFLAAGGALLWGNAQKDDQGYFATNSDRFHTHTYALATENLDVDADLPKFLAGDDRYGDIRLRVSPHTDKPVFVGIARTRDVDAYLRGTAHATVTDVDYSPFEADYATHAGRRPGGVPSAQRFWVASSQGLDTQTVSWNVEKGDWSVVVMNADGSRGVDAGVSAGARIPYLATIAWISLGIGALLVAGAAGLFYAGARPPRVRPESGALAPVPA